MGMWRVDELKRADITNPILIAGLPGIGNVGKIAADYIVDELKCEKVYSFFSHSLPHSVFVNENNLIDLPRIELHLLKREKNDLLILTGDIQPLNEVSCYDFCETVLDLFEKHKGKEIITLGGIGLRELVQAPKIYCTGNSKKMISRYKKNAGFNTNVYGVVGPIMGVAGLLLGLSKLRKIEAISLLAETLGHPMYLGLTGARQVLVALDKNLSLKIDLKNLDTEIKSIEEQIKKGEDLEKLPKAKYARKIQKNKEMNYIG